jgi:hypothetical protein
MSLELDSATWAEVNAVSAASARAAAVIAALANPVTFRVYDGSGTVMGAGTLSTPWAAPAGDGSVILVSGLVSFAAVVAGTPDSSWRARFESGARWLRGTFGLTGSGADFQWSGSTWTVGQPGSMVGVAIVCQAGPGGALQFGWINEAEVKSVSVTTGGAGYNVTADAVIPSGYTATFAVVPPVTGVAIDAASGVVTSSVDLTNEPVTVEIWDGVGNATTAEDDWLYRAGLRRNSGTGAIEPDPANDTVVWAHDFRYLAEMTNFCQSRPMQNDDGSYVVRSGVQMTGMYFDPTNPDEVTFETAKGYSPQIWRAPGHADGIAGSGSGHFTAIIPDAVAHNGWPDGTYFRWGNATQKMQAVFPDGSVWPSPTTTFAGAGQMCNRRMMGPNGWARWAAPFLAGGNGLPYDDNAAGGAIHKFTWNPADQYQVNTWLANKKGFWTHPVHDTWGDGEHVLGNEYWLQYRIKVSSSVFGSRLPHPTAVYSQGPTSADQRPYPAQWASPNNPTPGQAREWPWYGKALIISRFGGNSQVGVIVHDVGAVPYTWANPVRIESFETYRFYHYWHNWWDSSVVFESPPPDGTWRPSTALQTNETHDSSYHFTCRSGSDLGQQNDCWEWPVDEWVTVMVHFKPGRHCGQATPYLYKETIVDVKVARYGETAWTTIFYADDYNWSWFEDDPVGVPLGHNLFNFILYRNECPSWNEQRQDYSQIIFSTAPIPCPQIYGSPTVLAIEAAKLTPGSWSGHVLGNHSNAGGLNVVASGLLYPPTLTHEVSIPGADTMLAWSGKALWIPSIKRLVYSGGPVGNTYNTNHPGSAILQYDEDSDEWLVDHGTSGSLDGVWGRWAHAHNFDAADYDEATGHVFRHLSGNGIADPYTWWLGRFNPISRTMVGTPVPAPSWPASQAYPSCVMLRSQRKFLALFPGSTWQAYDVAQWPNAAWSTKSAPANFNSGLSVYHNGYVYITQGNVYVDGAGTGLERKGFYRVKDDATWQSSLETLADTPVGTSIGQSTNDVYHGMLCGLGNYLYLLSGNGHIYRYDPANNAAGWTDLGAIMPNINPNRTDELMHCTAAAIPERGVIVVLHGYDINYSTPATCRLWEP